MNNIEKLLTDECVLKFSNGAEVRGAANVSKLMLDCCIQYNNGFISGVTIAVIGSCALGVVLAGSGLGIGLAVKTIRSKKLKNEEA